MLTQIPTRKKTRIRTRFLNCLQYLSVPSYKMTSKYGFFSPKMLGHFCCCQNPFGYFKTKNEKKKRVSMAGPLKKDRNFFLWLSLLHLNICSANIENKFYGQIFKWSLD